MVPRHASALEALLLDDKFDANVYLDEPLSRHTSYRIGGPARFFVEVFSVGALAKLIEKCVLLHTPYFVMGGGTNVLVCDEGFEGVVISLGSDFRHCRYDTQSQRFSVGAAVKLSKVVQDAFRRSLAGLEFVVGTPGTVGGALFMNAGSRNRWIGSQVVSATIFSPTQGLVRRAGSDMQWGYRQSPFAQGEVVVECELSVEPADPFFIRGKMEASLVRRKKTQPLTQFSCGSVFKNPEGLSAGDLIQRSGLKGKRIGGAQVSDVHANFIVNVNDACAHDVRDLMKVIQAKVYETYGIKLQPEVRFLGFA